MSINNVCQFGALTSKQSISFEDFDKNGDGIITAEEYNSVLNGVECDSVELSVKNEVSEVSVNIKESNEWQQYDEMTSALNELKGQIAIDFAGEDGKFAVQAMDKLKEFLEQFKSRYEGENIEKMAETFKEILPEKYSQIKAEVLSNTFSAISSIVIEEVFFALTEGLELPEDSTKTLFKTLDAEAVSFAKNYKGDTFKEDLTDYLIESINTSDKQKLSDAADEWDGKKNSYGAYIDSNEIRKLKDNAAEFLKESISKGIVLTLQGTVIRTETAIKVALSKFTEGEELIKALDEAINSLSTESKMDSIEKAKAQKAEEERKNQFAVVLRNIVPKFQDQAYLVGLQVDVTRNESTEKACMNQEMTELVKNAVETAANSFAEAYTGENFYNDIQQHLTQYINLNIPDIVRAKQDEIDKRADEAFASIKGNEYNINLSSIDYDKRSEFRSRKSTIANDLRIYLENNGIKSQMKSKIQSMLNSKGLSYSTRISNIFENAYNKTLSSIVESISSRNIVKTSSGHYRIENDSFGSRIEIESRNIVSVLLAVFNDNIQKMIDEVNVTSKDMDLADMDYTVINAVTIGNSDEAEEIVEAFNNGTNYSASTFRSKNRAESNMERICLQLKPQLMSKAKAMCNANGVDFNNDEFNYSYGQAMIELDKFLGRNFNPSECIQRFMTKFKTEYTGYINRRR